MYFNDKIKPKGHRCFIAAEMLIHFNSLDYNNEAITKYYLRWKSKKIKNYS